jgi:hypothetical protein
VNENVSSINQIINGNDVNKASKFKEFFNIGEFENTITSSKINEFVDINYNLIFKY